MDETDFASVHEAKGDSLIGTAIRVRSQYFDVVHVSRQPRRRQRKLPETLR